MYRSGKEWKANMYNNRLLAETSRRYDVKRPDSHKGNQSLFFVRSFRNKQRHLINSKGKCLPDFRQTPKSALFMVLASVSAAAAVNMMMYALSLINVAVLFTLDNGGVLLVSVLWSVIFYKEKLNPIKIVGLILAAASLVALGALH